MRTWAPTATRRSTSLEPRARSNRTGRQRRAAKALPDRRLDLRRWTAAGGRSGRGSGHRSRGARGRPGADRGGGRGRADSCSARRSWSSWSARSPVGKTPGVTADDLHAEAGRKVIRFHLARMIAREAGTREGATTRRSSTGCACRPAGCEPPGASSATASGRIGRRSSGKRLRVVAARLGTVRDLDVLIEATEAFGGDPAGRSSATASSHSSPAWREQRDAGRRLLINELDSGGYQHGSSRTTATSRVTPGAAVRPVDPTSPHRVRDTAGSRIWQAYEQSPRLRVGAQVGRRADPPPAADRGQAPALHARVRPRGARARGAGAHLPRRRPPGPSRRDERCRGRRPHGSRLPRRARRRSDRSRRPRRSAATSCSASARSPG